MTKLARTAAGPLYYAILTAALAGFGLFYDLTAPPGPSRTGPAHDSSYAARAEHFAQADESRTADETKGSAH